MKVFCAICKIGREENPFRYYYYKLVSKLFRVEFIPLCPWCDDVTR